MLAALAISVVATGIIIVPLRESDRCDHLRVPERASARNLLSRDKKDCYQQESRQLSTREILALPAVGLLIALQFLVFLAFNFYYVAFPIHAAGGLGWSLTAVGTYFTVMAILMATVQGPVLTRLSKRWGDRTLVVGGGTLLAASFLFFASGETAVIYAGTALLAIGNGVMVAVAALAPLQNDRPRDIRRRAGAYRQRQRGRKHRRPHRRRPGL